MGGAIIDGCNNNTLTSPHNFSSHTTVLSNITVYTKSSILPLKKRFIALPLLPIVRLSLLLKSPMTLLD